jgi:hypothetical protein
MTVRGSNDYVIRLKTAKNLGVEAFVRTLLWAWLNDLPAPLRPEYFDLGEPVRRSFEKEGLDRAVQVWVDNQIPLYLSRRAKPRMMVATNWRPEKGSDPRPFPWGCTVWLARSAGDDLALALLRFLIAHFEPSFGSISSEDDSRAKHWVTFLDQVGRSERYVGLDVGRFTTITTDYGRDVLPGVYWATYFGPGAKALIGPHRFSSLRAHIVEKLGHGYLVRAYRSIAEAGTSAALGAEAAIREQLGEDRFFDKALVNVEALKADDVTAKRVERQINQVKAARK